MRTLLIFAMLTGAVAMAAAQKQIPAPADVKAAPADAKPMGDWTIVTRDDKTRQWAYKGRPLYTWIKDAKPGDTSGDGMAMGAWKVAVP